MRQAWSAFQAYNDSLLRAGEAEADTETEPAPGAPSVNSSGRPGGRHACPCDSTGAVQEEGQAEGGLPPPLLPLSCDSAADGAVSCCSNDSAALLPGGGSEPLAPATDDAPRPSASLSCTCPDEPSSAAAVGEASPPGDSGSEAEAEAAAAAAAACGLANVTLGTEPGLAAAASRAFSLLRHAPSSLAKPHCWAALASAAWSGDAVAQEDEGADWSFAGAAAAWLPAWAAPWAAQAEDLIKQQQKGGGSSPPIDIETVSSYLPSPALLSTWAEAAAKHSGAIAAGVATSAGPAAARVAAAGAVFVEFSVASLLFVNLLYYLLAAKDPWLKAGSGGRGGGGRRSRREETTPASL